MPPEGLDRPFDDPFRARDIEPHLANLRDDQRRAFWRLYSAKQNRLTRAEARQRRLLIDLFRRASKDIEARVAQEFAQAGVEQWDLQTMRRTGRDLALFRDIQARIGALGAQADARLEAAMTGHFKRSWLQSAWKLDELTPPHISVMTDLLPDGEILALVKRPFEGANFSQRLGIITDDMAHDIQRGLTRSMISGESWLQAARRIRGEMGTRGRKAAWRAEMIARTEITRAQEMANYEFTQANEDVIEKVVWMAHPGACPICRKLNGRVLKDASDYPPALSHPACTCDAVPVPRSWEDLAGASDVPVRPLDIKSWADRRGLPARTLELLGP